MANALVSVQVIPSVPDGEHPYDYVDAAIKVIDDAGVKYEVHALETTMEGELGELLELVQKMSDELVAMGAVSVMSQIKVVYQPSGIAAETLTEKYR